MKKIFLSYPGSRVRQATRHCWIKLSIYSVLAVFLMYFTIKYNVFYKYIINATTTAINACKKLFDVGQREVVYFIYVSYLTRESTLYFLNVSKYWKRWEKEANIVKGARFCYCRIYHKFVNFIILNLFKVVKWTSCLSILFRGILVLWLWYGSQINAPNYTTSKQTLTR